MTRCLVVLAFLMPLSACDLFRILTATPCESNADCDEGACVLGFCDPNSCVPQCDDGRECGADKDGCSCGTCAEGKICDEPSGTCECAPSCPSECGEGGCCGDDGCGGRCGSCGAGDVCDEDTGLCERCEPDCTDRVCGSDGCGGSCGSCLGTQEACSQAGQCECVPACEGKECGSDGCGGSCGPCGVQEACSDAGQCECAPSCDDKVCGDDGCGGSCGSCLDEQDACVDGQCVCQPACTDKQCGDDGCGGSCGACTPDLECDLGSQRCVEPNVAPTAVDDAFDASLGEPTVLDVLSNDIDPNTDEVLVVSLVDDPPGGVATIVESDRRIQYTPENATRGTDVFRYQVRDSRGAVDEGEVTITIVIAPLAVQTTSLPAAEANAPYAQTVSARGGVPPYTFALAAASAPLPAGLTLGANGLLSGTPTETGTFALQMEVSDDDGTTPNVAATLSLVVAADVTPPAAITASLAASTTRDRFVLRFTAPGDNGNTGRAAAYELKRSRSAISAGNFGAAETLSTGLTPAAAGTAESATIQLPWSDGTWFLALRAVDESGNAGALGENVAVDTEPRLAVSASLHDFGASIFKTFAAPAAGTQAFTLTNQSTLVDLVLSSIAVTGSSSYVVTSGGSASPVTIAPGATRDVTVAFAPGGPGTLTGTLALPNDDGHAGAPTGISLTGVGINSAPSVVVGTTALIQQGASSVLSVVVSDPNGNADVVSVVGDTSSLGGAAAAPFTPGDVVDDTHRTWTRTQSTSGAPSGSHVIALTARDTAGDAGSGELPVLLFSGTVREVGVGKAFANIKSAITAAVDGDMIAVFPGTYTGSNNKNMSIGKRVLILGIEGPAQTIIDCQNAGRVFNLTTTETTSTVVSGFTMQNCAAGAIRLLGTSLTVEDSVFTNNTTGDRGGAILVDGATSTLVVRRSTFQGNNAPTAGGAVASLNAASGTFDGCQFLENSTGVDGGAVVISEGSWTLRDVEFSSNNAGGTGGGLSLLNAPTVSVRVGTITGNTAAQGGGIHQNGGVLTVEDVTFEENRTTFQVGGGISVDGGSLTILRSNFIGNFANNYGGSLYISAGPLLMADSVLTEGTAGFGFASAFIRNGTVSRTRFESNPDWGAEAYDSSFEDCTFSSNGAGGVFGDSNTIVNSRFIGNRSGSGVSGSRFTIQGGLFESNQSPDFGGGVNVQDLTISTSTFRNNRASVGGALAIRRGTVTDCVFEGNQATDTGGAIHVLDGATTLENVLVAGNVAASFGGGISLAEAPILTIRNSTIAANTSGRAGGLWTNSTANIVLRDTIIFGNTLSNAPPNEDVATDLFVVNAAGVVVNIDHCDIDADGIFDPGLRVNPTAGNGYEPGVDGNLSANPLFVDPPGGNYRVRLASPVVNKGSDTAANLGLSTKTVLENNAADSGVVDLGYHFPR